MSDTRILMDETDITGIRRLHHYDDATDTVTIQTQQVMDDVLAANQANRNATDERAGWKGDMHLFASIPMVVMYDLKRRGILDNEKEFRKWLNEADQSIFRVRPGKI